MGGTFRRCQNRRRGAPAGSSATAGSPAAGSAATTGAAASIGVPQLAQKRASLP